MGILPGFWRGSTNFTAAIYSCIIPAVCIGGVEQICSNTNEGPLCSLCKPGYYMGSAHVCTVCPKEQISYAWVVFISILLVLFVLLQLYLVVRSSRHLAFAELKVAREADGIVVNDEDEDSDYDEDEENYEEFEAEKRMQGVVDNPYLITGQQAAPPDFTYKLKIVLGFAQICSNIATSLDIQWPPSVKSFLASFDTANVDYISLSSVDCVNKVSYYDKFLVTALVPLLIGAILLIIYGVYKLYLYLNRSTMNEFDTSYEDQSLNVNKIRAWRLLLFILFFIYPSVSSTILLLYVCKNIDNTWFLLADFKTHCYDATYFNYAYLGILFILIFPIGIPLFFFYLLYTNKDNLNDKKTQVQLGILYAGYQSSIWWFELIDMAHKLLLTSILAFLPQNYQMPCGMVFAIIYLIILLIAHPYIRKADDRLHIFAQIEIFLLMFGGYVYYSKGGFEETVTDVAVSIALIMIAVFFFAYFLLTMSNALYKKFQMWSLKHVRIGGRDLRKHFHNVFKNNNTVEDMWRSIRILDKNTMHINPLARDAATVGVRSVSINRSTEALYRTNDLDDTIELPSVGTGHFYSKNMNSDSEKSVEIELPTLSKSKAASLSQFPSFYKPVEFDKNRNFIISSEMPDSTNGVKNTPSCDENIMVRRLSSVSSMPSSKRDSFDGINRRKSINDRRMSDASLKLGDLALTASILLNVFILKLMIRRFRRFEGF